MAKTIKFNLVCDGKPVRTINDLQENFSIEDVLAYYHNRLLHRWLKVRGYSDELEKVSAITSTEDMDLIKELISIFEVDVDNEKVEECVYILGYLKKREDDYKSYDEAKGQTQRIINDYKKGYNSLVRGIIKNPGDAARIKANIEEIATNYKWVLDLDYRKLFWTLTEESNLAVMCLLMNEKTRDYYLPVEDETSDTLSKDKKEMYDEIKQRIYRQDFMKELGDNLKSYAGVTDGYWRDLEPKGKKCMILQMQAGNVVRQSGALGGDLAHKDIYNKFVILDGIDYKSNSATDKLLYMEV